MGLTSPPPPKLPEMPNPYGRHATTPPTPEYPPLDEWPRPAPISVVEKVLGRMHISTYNAQEAAHEWDAHERGEDYRYVTPETDRDGYLL